MDWMSDDASLGISQCGPQSCEQDQAPVEAQTLSGCLCWRGEKCPSIVITQQIAMGGLFLGLPGLDGAWVRANGRLLD